MANGTLGISSSPIATTAISDEYDGFQNKVTIAASETQDSSTFSVEIPKYATLEVTEGSDTSSFAADVISYADLATTEASDSIAGELLPGLLASEDSTETQDQADIQLRNNPENYMGIAGVPIATTAISGEIPNTFTYGVIFATLGASEAIDTLAATATKNEIAALEVTEATDSLSGSLSATHTSALSVTEATDSLSIGLAISDSASLDVTEATDSLTASAIRGHLADLQSTEATDTLDALVAAGDTIITFVAATEAKDTVAINILPGLLAQVGTSEASDTLLATLLPGLLSDIVVTEAADSFLGSLTSRHTLSIAATEALDTAFFLTGSSVAFNLTEPSDSALLQANVVIGKLQQAQFFMLFRS
jgi:hypothetical protein